MPGLVAALGRLFGAFMLPAPAAHARRGLLALAFLLCAADMGWFPSKCRDAVPDAQADEVITRIEKRIAMVTHLPEDNGEGLQILHYTNGQARP